MYARYLDKKILYSRADWLGSEREGQGRKIVFESGAPQSRALIGPCLTNLVTTVGVMRSFLIRLDLACFKIHSIFFYTRLKFKF